jgi:hypothetical protein
MTQTQNLWGVLEGREPPIRYLESKSHLIVQKIYKKIRIC